MLHKFARMAKDAQQEKAAKKAGRPSGRAEAPRRNKRENDVVRMGQIKVACEREGLPFEEYPDYRYTNWHRSARINGHNCRIMASSYTPRTGGREGLAYNRIVIPYSYITNFEFIVVVVNIDADTCYVIPTRDFEPLFGASKSHLVYYLPTGNEESTRYLSSALNPWPYRERWDYVKNPPQGFKVPVPSEEKSPLDKLIEEADAYEIHINAREKGGVSYKIGVVFTDKDTGKIEIFPAGSVYKNFLDMVMDAKTYKQKRGSEYFLFYITIAEGRLDLLKFWPFPEGFFESY